MSAGQGDWVHVYRMLFEHPKAKRLGKRLGLDPAAAAGYLVCLWTWAMAIAPDGDLSRFDTEDIEAAAGWGGEDGVFVAAATECRWLDHTKKGSLIHDWDDWAGTLVSKRAKERKRSADRRAAAHETEDVQTATAGRQQADHMQTNGRPLAERQTEEREEKEPPLPPQPVDNVPDQQRGCSIEQEEPGPEQRSDANGDEGLAANVATTCDGQRCLAHNFPASAFAPLRRAMLASLHPEQQHEVGKGGDLDTLLERYAAHICAACQASLAEFERPQRDGLCEQAIVEAVASLKGSQDVAAVMRSRLQRFGLVDLIGDRKLEELRRTRRDKRRSGEPQHISEVVCAPQQAAS